MKLKNIITTSIVTAAAITITAAPVSAAGLGHSVNGVRFTVKDGEDVVSVVHFDKLGRESDFDVTAHIQEGFLPEGDYYFSVEKDPDAKIRRQFEDAVSRSMYYLDDYDIVDIKFFDSDNNSIYTDAAVYFTKTDPIYFNCAFIYACGEFSRLDYAYCGNGISIKPATPEKVVVARLFTKHNIDKTNTTTQVSKIFDDIIIRDGNTDKEIVSNDGDGDGKIVDTTGKTESSTTDDWTQASGITDEGPDEELEYEENLQSGTDAAPEISVVDKLTPGGKDVATGDTGTVAAVVSVVGAAALFTVFAASKMKKDEE